MSRLSSCWCSEPWNVSRANEEQHNAFGPEADKAQLEIPFQYLQSHKEQGNGVFSKETKKCVFYSVLVYVFRSLVSTWHDFNVDLFKIRRYNTLRQM